MNKNVSINVNEQNDKITIEIFRNEILEKRFSYNKEMTYEHPMLSLENLSYYITEIDENEEDDYLLFHALQENKKPSLSIFTDNKEVIREIFSDKDFFSTVEKKYDSTHSICYVAKNACLNDFFDINAIEDWYDKYCIYPIYYNILEYAAQLPIIDVLSGEVEIHGVPFSVVQDIEFPFDNVVRTYKATGFILSGLLLGYPLEATLDLINSVCVYLR